MGFYLFRLQKINERYFIWGEHMGQVLVVFMFLLSIRFDFSIKPVKLVGKPRKLSAVLLCSIFS